MAEYKYRALGWKDDDIASLNVVGGTAADNQVELQITKQGAGGTIDGPAIVGKDGITINKAADSEKIEISGSGCVQKDTSPFIVYGTDGNGDALNRRLTANPVPNAIVQYDNSGKLSTSTPINDLDCTNKKYVDDNYVKLVDPGYVNTLKVYGYGATHDKQPTLLAGDLAAINYTLAYRNEYATFDVGEPQKDSNPATKKYVDNSDKALRLKLSNLEQALNGYILDTTKEAYADLDSAVLKNSVAVGDNVYPIADKTRALVTRIEGKTMKMVQLANTETLDNKQIKNGITLIKNADGSLTANGTATAKTWGLFAFSSSSMHTVAGSKYLLLGSPDGYGPNTYHLIDGNGKISEGEIRTSDGSAMSIRVVFVEGFVAENITFKPQLFNLTAMYGEGNEPTTVEQFKADFPNAFYPYAEGDLYPAKISGVKFTGKNLFDLNPNNLIFNTGNVEVVGNNIIITGYKENGRFTYKAIPLIIGETYTVSVSNYTKENSNALGLGISYDDTADITFGLITETKHTFTFKAKRNQLFIKGYITYNAGDAKITISNLQVETGSQATPYEPYIEPVSVTLPETYDLHGIGDYKDYLEITKNENNELYTLKKVQSVEVNESEKTITPLATPVETVIATNLTYEQVTAVRHNGGLIEVEGNTNKGYARPTVTNTIVYRLTAKNTAEG